MGMELALVLLVGLGVAVAVAFFLRSSAKTPAPPTPVQSAPQATAPPAATQPADGANELQQAFNKSSNNPMYDLSIEGGGLTWNDAFYQVFGYDHSEPSNTSEWWASHIHPDDAMAVNEHMDKLRDPSFTGWEASYRFKKADGNYVLITDHVLIRRDKDGQAASLLGTMNVQAISAPASS